MVPSKWVLVHLYCGDVNRNIPRFLLMHIYILGVKQHIFNSVQKLSRTQPTVPKYFT